MKVHYPIKTKKLNELDTSSKYGNYLIGSNNTWHGGIHVERKDEEIKAIVDGRIIAYRFMDTYKEVSRTENSIDASNEEVAEKNQYSNCFVLIQHDLELKKTVEEGEGEKKTTKEEKKYVTFYSLYNHLLPVAEMNNKSLVPDMMATTKLKVTENEGFIYPKKTIKGLNARKLSSGNNIVMGSTGVKFVIPYGELVTKQFDSSNKLIESDGYTKIEYNGKYGYIYAKGNRIVDLGTQFQITTKEDDKIIEDKSGVPDDKKDLTGARVRKTGQGSEIVDIIPTNDEVIIEEKKGNWYKIKGYEGYSHKSNFSEKKLVDESKITKDAIIACDIPIKAGDGIGYTGLVQLSNGKNTEDYYATHVEVFMGDETEDFLNNTFDAGNDKKDYILLKEGTKLKKEITQKVNLKKNLPIKIVDIKRIYVKIKENREEAEGIVKLSEVTYQGKITDPKTNTARDYYTINKASFNAVNTKFKNKLPKEETVHLFWVNRVDSNGNTVSKNDEKKLQDSEKYRKLRYTPVNSANEYWVEAKDIMPTVEYVEVEREKRVPKKLSTWERIKDYVVDVEKYEIKKVKVCEPKKLPLKRGEKTVTSNAITKVYLAIPEKKNDVDEELCKDVVVNISKSEKITVTKDTEYIKVACTYPIANERYTQQGWVLASDLNIEKNAFSAYNWDKFSFKSVNGGSEYIYDIQGLREAEKTYSTFVKEVWKSLDLDNNGEIELGEVQKAYSILETRNQLTKLVCQHKNEWSYTGDELAGEIEKYFDYFINHKDTEEHTKKDLKALKKKKLDVLKEQAKELMFWKEASKRSAAVTLEERMEKDNSGTLKPKGIESLDKSIEASKTENTEQKSGTVSIEERAKDENGFINLMKLGIELKKEEERKEEPKKEEKNPKPERTFPSTENVYHFHPIAFVNHMKRILGNGGNCESLIWGDKVSCDFRAKVIKIASNLWGEGKKIEMANNLMAVFAWESGGTFKPDAPNQANSGATGLIQFMPDTAAELLGKKTKELTIETAYNYWGKHKTLKRVKEFADMSDLEQLDYVEKYFKTLKGKNVEFVDFYLQVLYPASMGKPDSHIVFSKDGTGLLKTDSNYKSRINAYSQNKGFDTNKAYGNNDGMITKAEIKKGVQKYLNEGEKFKNDCNSNCTLNKKVKEGFDIDAAVSYLNKKAHSKSQGECALYVRKAIDAGGLLGLRGNAKDYYHNNKLTDKGFTVIGRNKNTITFKKGDIAVFKEQTGHKWGHIQMYNGSQWVSDFKQNTFWVNKIYKTKKEYKIFRWE